MERPVNSEQLKTHTHKVHVQLEQTLIPIIQNIRTQSQYANLLKIFYTFYSPIENQLSSVTGIESLTSGIGLRKTDSLRKDILALKASTDHLALCSDLPTCTNLSHAFGIMYVLEGSVLGGNAISKMVTKQLPTEPPPPFSFFLHYGNDAKIKWQHFKTKLDSNGDLLQSDLFSAATDTFTLFNNWIEKNSTSFVIQTL
ncbi:MAG TPA: biliverdin-producing heme oxygenase [Ohtaekwangia sp.]|nr:biliverdin-producing heme oxygenase [Ohtaekwangia sp.]